MTTEVPSSALKGHTIRIGIGVPLSGPSARLGREMTQAVELAFEEANVAGGILGAPVVGEVRDDQGKPANGGIVARAFAGHPDVLGVIGHYNSDVTLAALPVYDALDMTTITPIASNPAVTAGARNMFRFTNRDDETARAIADYLHAALGKRRAVVIESTTLYGGSMAREFMQTFTRLGGQILARQVVAEGQRFFGPLVQNLPGTFDVLFYGGSFEGAFILKAMRKAGLSQLFAAGDGCWDLVNFLEPAGEATMAGEGVLVLSATPEVGRVPGSQAFAERYRQRYGPIGNYAVNSYDAARVLLCAIEQAITVSGGLPARCNMTTAMRNQWFEGIAYRQPVSWDEHGDNRAAVTSLNVVEGGRFHEVAEIGRSA